MAAKKKHTGAKRTKKNTAKAKPKQADFKLNRERMREPVSNVDVNTAKLLTLEKERARVYKERGRLKKKLAQATKKVDIKAIRSRIRRTTYFLNSIKKRKGSYRELKGFKEQVTEISPTVLENNIYKWDARTEVDDLLNAAAIKHYVINGEKFSRRSAGLILSAVDDLETECDLTGSYYMVFTFDYKTKTLTVEKGR